MRVYIAAYALLLGLLAYLGLSVAGLVPQPAEREGSASVGFVLAFVTWPPHAGAMRHGGGGSGLQAPFRRSSSDRRGPIGETCSWGNRASYSVTLGGRGSIRVCAK